MSQNASRVRRFEFLGVLQLSEASHRINSLLLEPAIYEGLEWSGHLRSHAYTCRNFMGLPNFIMVLIMLISEGSLRHIFWSGFNTISEKLLWKKMFANGISFHEYESFSLPRCLLMHLTRKIREEPATTHIQSGSSRRIWICVFKLGDWNLFCKEHGRESNEHMKIAFPFSVVSLFILFGVQCDSIWWCACQRVFKCG